ncbi:MAG: helix-turn-helix transcriptional regulator [Planctomycetes bacterium]|nr:helix-turn-helix transcriptional regulator [Planctomycetota bacterium]
MLSAEADLVWKALADPTRRALLDALGRGRRTTGELCTLFENELTRTAVMKHLGILEAAHLLLVRREGRFRWNYINPVPIERICQRWVSKHTRSVAAGMLGLKSHLERGKPATKPKGKRRNGN